jgi:glucose-6-phosphate isomerase
MKKVVRLTESELIRFVKRVIQENEEETDKKLLSNFFTVENNFQYVNTKDGVDVYVLKNKGFDVMVGVKPSEQPNSIVLLIFVILPSGKRINYLENVTGRMGSIIPINDYGNMIQLLQGAINFGREQSNPYIY